MHMFNLEEPCFILGFKSFFFVMFFILSSYWYGQHQLLLCYKIHFWFLTIVCATELLDCEVDVKCKGNCGYNIKCK